MTIARRHEKYLTEESIGLYLKHNTAASLSDMADLLDGEMYRLSQFKLLIQKRRLKER
jgi:hypothetical protein